MKIEYGILVPARKGRPPSNAGKLMSAMKKGGSLLLNKKPSAVIQLARRYIGVGKYTVRVEKGKTRVWKTK